MMMLHFMVKLYVLGILLLVVDARQAKSVLLIVADDLGYNEHNFMGNGSKVLITPNLDTLASEGVILQNYYVQPICSPTRSALMTGRYDDTKSHSLE